MQIVRHGLLITHLPVYEAALLHAYMKGWRTAQAPSLKMCMHAPSLKSEGCEPEWARVTGRPAGYWVSGAKGTQPYAAVVLLSAPNET